MEDMKIIEAIKKLKNRIQGMDEEKTLKINGVYPEKEEKLKWHRAEKELPTDDVILRTKSGYMFIGYYCISEQCYIYNECNLSVAIKKEEVIAWCQLPKYDLKD